MTGGKRFDIIKEKIGTVVKVTGVFQQWPDDEIIDDINDVMDEGEKTILLDLNGASLVTSIGIRTLFAVQEAVEKAGAKLIVRCSKEDILRLLKDLKIHGLFEFME